LAQRGEGLPLLRRPAAGAIGLRWRQHANAVVVRVGGPPPARSWALADPQPTPVMSPGGCTQASKCSPSYQRRRWL
jgi:hypothetical protein